jgi:hypothetical protein
MRGRIVIERSKRIALERLGLIERGRSPERFYETPTPHNIEHWHHHEDAAEGRRR